MALKHRVLYENVKTVEEWWKEEEARMHEEGDFRKLRPVFVPNPDKLENLSFTRSWTERVGTCCPTSRWYEVEILDLSITLNSDHLRPYVFGAPFGGYLRWDATSGWKLIAGGVELDEEKIPIDLLLLVADPVWIEDGAPKPPARFVYSSQE